MVNFGKKRAMFDPLNFTKKKQQYQNLGRVSPVVRALAQEQFDDYVKRVRFFVDPQLIDQMRQIDDLSGLIEESLEVVGE